MVWLNPDSDGFSFVWNTVDHTNDFQEHLSQEECSISETFNNLQERMVSSCSRIWEAVKDVLCNDSPEGHLPQDIDDIDTIDTKDVLSYSFRAIHESRYARCGLSRSVVLLTLVCKQSYENSSWQS
jgi:hypothetical protein